MSIQEQILRIEQDKIKIRNKMVELGKATKQQTQTIWMC